MCLPEHGIPVIQFEYFCSDVSQRPDLTLMRVARKRKIDRCCGKVRQSVWLVIKQDNRHGRVRHAVQHLVDGAVAADRHESGETLCRSLSGPRRGIARGYS